MTTPSFWADKRLLAKQAARAWLILLGGVAVFTVLAASLESLLHDRQVVIVVAFAIVLFGMAPLIYWNVHDFRMARTVSYGRLLLALFIPGTLLALLLSGFSLLFGLLVLMVGLLAAFLFLTLLALVFVGWVGKLKAQSPRVGEKADNTTPGYFLPLIAYILPVIASIIVILMLVSLVGPSDPILLVVLGTIIGIVATMIGFPILNRPRRPK